ncbi:MAG TPA: Rne/Rng family ribonuclease [Oscillatoriaceae cyanobacterium M33_DOE_052]|uniref:Rne/Rng family ribonuclease n=1 Tax=Planktothricoides sp. SpSt-374 TaxID=2282167 RepID=A0A7C3ZJ32_9CYAN|nr:Rne/Rng family ribonuclease [Oscillatoriaceae cyanobacterium M33_DOE_052]
MPKQIIIAEQHRIAAVFSEDQIQELVVAKGTHQVGDIYLGIVENVLPGIDAAFVNIGDPDRNGFIHVTDLGPLRLKRSSGAITELLAPQQKVLVQVMKEPTGNKGPRLTGNITLPGRYLVLMPFGRGVNLSRRIRSEAERSHLRALGILIKPAGMGLLVRTEAEGVEEEAILEDLESLQKQWELIQRETTASRAPALLNRDDDFIQRVLREMYSNDVNRIVVDSPTAVKRVKQQLLVWSGGKSPQGVLIEEHRDSRMPVLEYFRVNAAIREALKPRVDLPSGGYIIIEPTEALTVIDVNSGSFTRSQTSRETVLWTNCEAATEIARQLRLRNLAGVIIVDFIDMDSRRDQLQVLEHFSKALKADKARPQIAQLSELGLVELTRKRQGQNIYELFGRTCSTCGGLGHTVHLPTEGDLPSPPPADSRITLRKEADAILSEPGPGRYAGASEGRGSSIASESLPTISRIIPDKSVILSDSNQGSQLPLPVGESRPRTIAGSAETIESLRRDPSAPELVNDLQDLDLLNHPNYQVLGGANTRRRRRRRVGGEEVRFLGSDKGEFLDEPASDNTSSVGLPLMSDAASDSFDDGDASVTMVETRYDSATPNRTVERLRPVKREIDKSFSEPPEVISVEMTPDEQDVYALMGITPLVMFPGEVKNPKAVTVSIKEPGFSSSPANWSSAGSTIEGPEAAETPAFEGEETPAFEGEETPAFEGEETPAFEGEETPGFEGEETPAFEGEETPAFEGEETPTFEGEETPAFAAADPFEEDDEDIDAIPATTRRRRRRSSAVE